VRTPDATFPNAIILQKKIFGQIFASTNNRKKLVNTKPYGDWRHEEKNASFLTFKTSMKLKIQHNAVKDRNFQIIRLISKIYG